MLLMVTQQIVKRSAWESNLTTLLNHSLKTTMDNKEEAIDQMPLLIHRQFAWVTTR